MSIASKELDAVRTLLFVGDPRYRVGFASEEDKAHLQGFEVWSQKASPRYGLVNADAYLSEYPRDKVEFLCAWDQDSRPVGHFRLLLDRDLGRFSSLYPDTPVGSRVLDVGGHTAYGSEADRKVVHACLWALLIRVAREIAATCVYAQCRPEAVATMEAFGFRACSSAYTAVGWRGAWRAICTEEVRSITGPLSSSELCSGVRDVTTKNVLACIDEASSWSHQTGGNVDRER